MESSGTQRAAEDGYQVPLFDLLDSFSPSTCCEQNLILSAYRSLLLSYDAHTFKVQVMNIATFLGALICQAKCMHYHFVPMPRTLQCCFQSENAILGLIDQCPILAPCIHQRAAKIHLSSKQGSAGLWAMCPETRMSPPLQSFCLRLECCPIKIICGLPPVEFIGSRDSVGVFFRSYRGKWR